MAQLQSSSVTGSLIVSGALEVLGTFTGSIESAATASYVNPLVQDVSISGDLVFPLSTARFVYGPSAGELTLSSNGQTGQLTLNPTGKRVSIGGRLSLPSDGIIINNANKVSGSNSDFYIESFSRTTFNNKGTYINKQFAFQQQGSLVFRIENGGGWTSYQSGSSGHRGRLFYSGSDAVMQINNGPNFGLFIKGTANTPYIGAISTGTLRFAPMDPSGNITGNTLMDLQFGGGTVNVYGALQAQGAIRTQFSSSFEVGYFNGGDNGIVWKNSGYSKFSAGIKAVDTQNYSRMGLAFYTGDDANTTTDAVERMRITRTGNVGFGTSTFNNNVGFAVYKSYSAFENGTDHLTLRPGTGLYYSSDLKFVNQSYANRGSTSGDALRMTLTADGAVTASRFFTSINDTSGNVRASYDSLFTNNENETSFRSRMQAFSTNPIRNNYHFQATSGSTDTNVFYVKDTGKTYIKEDLTVENGVTVTGSLNVLGDITHDGDLTVTGTVTAQEFKTEFVSASIVYRSGSTKFGDTSDDTHSFTGSLQVSGGIYVSDTSGTPRIALEAYDSNEIALRTSRWEAPDGDSELQNNGGYLTLTNNSNIGDIRGNGRLILRGANGNYTPSITLTSSNGGSNVRTTGVFNNTLIQRDWTPGSGSNNFTVRTLELSDNLAFTGSTSYQAIYINPSDNIVEGGMTSVEALRATTGSIVLESGNLQVTGSAKFTEDVLIGQFSNSTSKLRFANVSSEGNSAYIGRSTSAQFEINPGSVTEFRIQVPAGADTHPIRFHGEGGLPVAQFYRNQRVRIGGNLSTNPASTLEVIGDTTLSGSLVVSGSSDASGILTTNSTFYGSYNSSGTAVGLLRLTPSNNTQLRAQSGNSIALETAGQNTMWVGSDQNIGIGTITPSSKLHIVAPAFTTGDTYSGLYLSIDSNNTGKGNYGPGIIFGGTAVGNTGTNQDGAAIFGIQGTDDEDNVGLGFALRSNVNNTNRSPAAVLIGTGSNGSDIRFGIATVNPDYTLDVSGDAQVRGKIYIDDGLENSYLRYGQVNNIQDEGDYTVILFPVSGSDPDPGDQNYADGTYYIRRSTGLLAATSVDVHINTNDFGSAVGYLNVNNVQDDGFEISAVTIQTGSAWYAGIRISGSALPRGAGYYNGFINNSDNNAFTVKDNTDADVTIVDTISSFGADNSSTAIQAISQADESLFKTVGIGTTTPAHLLDVSGSAFVEDNLYLGNSSTLALRNSTSALEVAASNQYQLLLRFGIGGSKYMQLGAWSGDYGRISYKGQNNLYLGSSGQVGIGANAPSTAERLYVSGSANQWGIVTLRGISDSYNPPSYYFSAGNAHNFSRPLILQSSTYYADGNSAVSESTYRFGNSNGIFNVAHVKAGVTQDGTVFNISGSSVGVGTTTPDSALEVTGTIYQDAEAGIDNYFRTNHSQKSSTTALNPGILVYGNGTQSANSNYGMDLGYDSGIAKYRTRIFTSPTQDISFGKLISPATAQSNFTEQVTIKGPTGNVGIGTTSPSAKLHVLGDVLVSGSQGDIEFASTGAQIKFNRNADNYIWASGSTSSLKFGAGADNEFVTLRYNGNMGVGTTAPEGVLHAQGDTVNQTVFVAKGSQGGNLIKAFEGGGGQVLFTLNGSLGDFVMLRSDTSNSYINTAKLGIGTTTPAEKLTVAGNISGSGNLVVEGSIEGASKSFNIPHPTLEGKRLIYGSLEGPEHGVYARGRVEGNVIELPDYWTGLVDEDTITVQLTSIGKHQNLYVEDIRDNKVFIKNGNLLGSGIKAFYFIQAMRKDIDKLQTVR